MTQRGLRGTEGERVTGEGTVGTGPEPECRAGLRNRQGPGAHHREGSPERGRCWEGGRRRAAKVAVRRWAVLPRQQELLALGGRERGVRSVV